jgi:hypothetical protein
MCVLLFLDNSACFADFFALQTMYQGVIRDDERRKRKMKEREGEFMRSQRKREIYERVQRVETIPPSEAPGQ